MYKYICALILLSGCLGPFNSYPSRFPNLDPGWVSAQDWTKVKQTYRQLKIFCTHGDVWPQNLTLTTVKSGSVLVSQGEIDRLVQAHEDGLSYCTDFRRERMRRGRSPFRGTDLESRWWAIERPDLEP